jgi:hypothetical protein
MENDGGMVVVGGDLLCQLRKSPHTVTGIFLLSAEACAFSTTAVIFSYLAEALLAG